LRIAACDELSRIDCGFYLTEAPSARIALLELWAGKMELEMRLISQEPAAGSQKPASGSHGLYVDGSPGGDHDIGNRGDNHSGIV
jgi:hypothetical protein